MAVTTQTQTLAAFVLARVAEDEAGEVQQNVTRDGLDRVIRVDEVRVPPSDRWLAECAAHRRIVELHPARYPDSRTPECECCAYFGALVDWPCPTLRALAATYAAHEDYRPEWRP